MKRMTLEIRSSFGKVQEDRETGDLHAVGCIRGL